MSQSLSSMTEEEKFLIEQVLFELHLNKMNISMVKVEILHILFNQKMESGVSEQDITMKSKMKL